MNIQGIAAVKRQGRHGDVAVAGLEGENGMMMMMKNLVGRFFVDFFFFLQLQQHSSCSFQMHQIHRLGRSYHQCLQYSSEGEEVVVGQWRQQLAEIQLPMVLEVSCCLPVDAVVYLKVVDDLKG